MRRILLILIIVLMAVSPALARNYQASSLTGGGAGSLDSLDITGASAPNTQNLADGDGAFVNYLSGSTAIEYFYIFDVDGTDAESSPTVIRPDDYSTAGVWRLAKIHVNALPDETEAQLEARISDVTNILSKTEADALYAPIAQGITNGDSHDHSGGDGAQIDHGGLAGLGDDDHTQYAEHAGQAYTGRHDFTGGTVQMANGTSLPGTCSIGDLYWDSDADTDGSLYVCRATNTWKEVDDDGASGGGDVTSVLDDLTGDVPVLYQAATAFTNADTTPDVSGKTTFRTANSSATTISDFDWGGGSAVDGQIIFVFINDANTTFDFTSSGLEGATSDYAASTGELLIFYYSGNDSQWHVSKDPGAAQTSGITRGSSGVPDIINSQNVTYEGSPSAARVINVVDEDMRIPGSDAVGTDGDILKIQNGASPTVDAAGEPAIDTTSDQFIYYGGAKRVLHYTRTECVVVENLAAADDNYEIFMANDAITITGIGVHCRGTCTTAAQISLEDRSGNAMTHTTPTASTGTGNTTFQSVTAANALVAGEGLAFDTDNAVSPETDEYTICFTYEITAD